MQLRRLRLRNIRSYESADLELLPGTTLISGDVGSGKTSLLYAIEMALFGFAEVEPTHLIRHGAVHAEVTATLEHDGHTYEVSRYFRRAHRRGKETFDVERLTFSRDGAKTEYSTTELRQRVIDLFGFPDNPNPRTPSDLWRWAVYVPQERMREVLAQRPEERLETVRKALGVERYRVAAENAAEVAAELRQTARHRREAAERLAHHESDLGRIVPELDAVEATRLALSPRLDRARERLESSARERELAESSRQVVLGDRRELEGLQRESERDSADLKARELRKAAIAPQLAESTATAEEELEALRARIAALDAERPALESARKELDREREGLEARLRSRSEARAELAGGERRRREGEEELARSESESTRARAELEAARTDGPAKEPPEPTRRPLSEIDAELARARERERAAAAEAVEARTESVEWGKLLAAGVCPRCRQPVRADEFEPHRAESERRLADARRRAETAHAEVGAIEEERAARERFERARERWLEAERRRRSAEEACARAEERRALALTTLDSSRSAERIASARAEGLEAAVEEESAWKRRSTELEARRARLDLDLKTARERCERALGERERRRELVEEDQRIGLEIASLARRIAERRSAVERLRISSDRLPDLERALGTAVDAEVRAREELERLRREEVRLQGEAQALRGRRAVAEDGVAERIALVADATELEGKAEWVAHPFREALLVMEGKILASAQANFQKDFDRYFRALLDDPRIEARVGESFTPSVLLDGEWTPPDALSGGERTSLALAFRLALGRVVRTMGDLHLDTLILDEPTDGFSPEQIVRMGDLLETLHLPQVILVSHESELAGVADHVFEARKSEGVSQLSGGRGASESAGPSSASDDGPPPRRRRSTRSRDSGLPPGGGPDVLLEGRRVPRGDGRDREVL